MVEKRDWESDFRKWAKPPSKTETDKCDNAVSVISNATAAYAAFKGRIPRVFPQGSYANRTNVGGGSDVDICVISADNVFYYDLRPGMTKKQCDIRTTPFTYADFKEGVYEAIKSYLKNPAAIKRGDKAFDIHENTYRIDADVVPCFEYRRYERPGVYIKPTGIAFYTAGWARIVNWPQQNYDNGCAKNDATKRRFKAIVRVLKNLRNEMGASNKAVVAPIKSFLIESLVWNVPDACFGNEAYSDDVRATLVHLYQKTKTGKECDGWGEINERQYLFRGSRPWTPADVNAFILAAWRYVGFE